MYKLLRIALFAAPLAGGVAWAQGSGTSGWAPAPGMLTPPVTDDTRTPLQQKAGRIDDTTPVLPGDATKPVDIPNTVPESNRAGIPEKKGHVKKSSDKKSIEKRSSDALDDTTTKMQNRSDSDLTRDQLDSDK
jgi:hypothetical protein